jgi:tetratricopeptide (TPR) repeat protein
VKAVVVALVVLCSRAYADVPWAQGVVKDKQTQANALFAEANQLFAQQAHAPALEKYRAAVALWDHPLIQFNMAVTLVRLDRILEAAEALDRALRFDAAPFPAPEQYQQALDYQKLVAGRVGTIGAECKQQGVAILLDGKPWFTCPGTQSIRVLAGEHVVVAEAKGMMTVSRRSVVVGRGSSMATFQLLPIDDVVKLEYPTPRWIPWTIAGGGAAIGLGGLGLWFAGKAAMDRFDARADMLCELDGCSKELDANETERDLKRQRDNAKLEGNIGIGMMVAGGAIAVGGVVWAVINRPNRVLPSLEVAPTSGGMSASAGWRF